MYHLREDFSEEIVESMNRLKSYSETLEGLMFNSWFNKRHLCPGNDLLNTREPSIYAKIEETGEIVEAFVEYDHESGEFVFLNKDKKLISSLRWRPIL